MENINWSDVIPPTLAQLILIGTDVSWVTVIFFATFLDPASTLDKRS